MVEENPNLKEQRDKKLDDLKTAFNEFAQWEKDRVNKQITLLESMIDGRGLGAVQSHVLNTISTMAVDELALFLSGDV